VLPATTLPQGETWDVGLSVFSGTEVTHEASSRVTVKERGVPIVFESVADIDGPFEVTMVGMEDLSGDIAADRLFAEWNATREKNEVFSISVMQPRAAAFVRDGVTRDSGSVLVGEAQTARADQPLAFVNLVCRPRKSKEALRVQATLSGSELAFAPKEIPPQDGLCVQIRDVVPAGTLGAGKYTYTVRIDGTDASKSRSIEVRD